MTDSHHLSRAKTHRARRAFRAGVTVLEVLFASGIAILGLLGIASLLPLAARQANQANQATEGQAYGQRYYADFMARGFNNSANWRWYDDTTRTFATDFDNSAAVPSTGGSGGNVSTPYRHAICIDPGFFAEATTVSAAASSVFDGSIHAYRVGLFPYYQDTYDPTSNPSVPVALVAPPALLNRPRLLRVSLHDPSSFLNVIPAKLVDRLFRSLDDLAITLPDGDKTLPPSRIYDPNSSQALPKSEFSWLATLTPREFNGQGIADYTSSEDYYTLSIVVMHRRDRAWFAPLGTESNSLPQGERLFGVVPLSGDFVGGDGGRVQLVTNTGTEDEMGVGDWVMLSRYQSADPLNRGIVCRWYRIIGADVDAIVDDSTGTWSKNVVLEGPDWVFGDPALPTQATFVDGVVSVFERIIPVH